MLKVKTPQGYFLVKENGTENDYPGVVVFFSPDGYEDGAYPLAVIEHDSETEELKLRLYEERHCDEPTEVRVLPNFCLTNEVQEQIKNRRMRN